MKSNNSLKLNFVEKFKYLMIIPIVLAVAAIIVGAICGLNLDYDFKNVSTFNIKFNTTITTGEYKVFMNEVDKMCDDTFADYRIEKIGEGVQNGIIVKIANDGSLDSKISDFKTQIEDELLNNVSSDIDSAVIITTSDTLQVLPKNVTSLVWYSILAIGCIMLFVFVYYWVRYNFVASLSIVLTFLLEIAMLSSVMIVARIPFNYYFVVSYFVMNLVTLLISIYTNNYIRKTLKDEKYNKYSNSDRVYDACKSTFRPVILLISILCLSLIAVMFFGDVSLIYIVISILVGLLITLFAHYIFSLSFWALLYNREKDAILRRKLDNEKKKAMASNSNTSDDKILV